jgi:mono/diheme cytochrome c family protein
MIRIAQSTALFAAVVVATAASTACAAEDKIAAGMGHELAQRLCTYCHLIEPGQVNPPGHVGGPTFQSVADRPSMTANALRTHLRTTRSDSVIPLAMPNPDLTDDEAHKITAYIMSLHAQQ